MKVSGACHCGEITFEAELDPSKVGICHCSDCQALSASAFRTIAIIPAADFNLTRGIPKEYVKIGDSGNGRIQAFCGNCGSGIYATNADGPPITFNIRLGTLEQRLKLTPQFECWTHSSVPWFSGISGSKKFGGNPS